MKKSKQAFIHSVIALLLCVSMFVGTTFAWFTDSVTSMKNIIQAGTLDIELEYMDARGNWHSVNQNTNVFDEDALWEPGHTEVVYLRVINKGNLALKYQLGVNVESETPGTNVAGDQFKLSDYIKMGAVEGVTTAYTTRDEARKAVTTSGTLASGYVTYGKMLANDPMQYIALVVYMPEEVDNVANYRGDAVPTIHLGINLLATQFTNEKDSFGSDYDSNANLPVKEMNYSASTSVANKVENNKLTEAVTIGHESDDAFANVPAGVLLAPGAEELQLSINTKTDSDANVKLDNGETLTPLDVHVEGVASENTVPMQISVPGLLRVGLNRTSVALYHVENGVTVPMIFVETAAEVDQHNEFYYDPYTGLVVLSMAGFSEVAVAVNGQNPWEGTSDTSWYTQNGAVTYADGEDYPYFLSTAEHLAGLAELVDQGTDFAGVTIKLSNDIDLEGYKKENGKDVLDDEGNKIRISFDPIGSGYEASGGKVFKGTFDGQNNYIFNLYQNGWDLGLSYCTLGGGLFASVVDAKIKNLTISGANIVMECVDMGILVGYSQGECYYENINIFDSTIQNYNRNTGGVVGEVTTDASGESKHHFTNVHVGHTTTVSSLWGSFDTSLGGIIGGRWERTSDINTEVYMTNCTVACKLDAYNDVTAAYEWYAYRRCGMLIGNTEEPVADGKNAYDAKASFLYCENVKVYYGDWINYSYCQFSNMNYPWVRVQAGLSNSAYSNPRYGHPTDADGKTVTTAEHKHQDGDKCTHTIPFGQLYGGGQGVYGAADHKNADNGTDNDVDVDYYDYAITYINNRKVLAVTYVTDNSKDEPTKNDDAAALADAQGKEKGSNVSFDYWMNAGSSKVESILADNEEDVVLYPSYTSLYTVSFVDQNGDILAYGFYTVNEKNVVNISEIVTAEAVAKGNLPPVEDGIEFDYWKAHGKNDTSEFTGAFDMNNLATLKMNLTVYPQYKCPGVRLDAVDDGNDGVTENYVVQGFGELGQITLVEIPAYINGKPVTTINPDAFSGYDDLHSVRIPGTITSIGYQAFSADTPYKWNDPSTWGEQRDTITMYYDGDPAVWKAAMEDYNKRIFNDDSLLKSGWDNMMGEGSCVFFLDNNGKVITTEYWELAKVSGDYVWQYHNHAYRSNGSCGNEHNNTTTYTDQCNCDMGKHPRDDAKYWTPVTTTGDDE